MKRNMNKIFCKIALCGAAAFMLAACSDEPHGVSTKHPIGSEGPDRPRFDQNDNVT